MALLFFWFPAVMTHSLTFTKWPPKMNSIKHLYFRPKLQKKKLDQSPSMLLSETCTTGKKKLNNYYCCWWWAFVQISAVGVDVGVVAVARVFFFSLWNDQHFTPNNYGTIQQYSELWWQSESEQRPSIAGPCLPPMALVYGAIIPTNQPTYSQPFIQMELFGDLIISGCPRRQQQPPHGWCWWFSTPTPPLASDRSMAESLCVCVCWWHYLIWGHGLNALY